MITSNSCTYNRFMQIYCFSFNSTFNFEIFITTHLYSSTNTNFWVNEIFFFYSSGLSVLDLVDQHETIDIGFLTEEKVICSIYLFF